ncbi:MAG: hypothetical protein ABI688_04715 [Bacteroidota bacterium]
MKNSITFLFLLFVFASCKGPSTTTGQSKSAPSSLLGNFTDDYGISYSINDILWVQHPNIKYHIIQWNEQEQYLVARNDVANPSEAGLYTRIDYMYFEKMEPFKWGFCLTVYNAKTQKEALTTAKADRQNPRKGCGGYPFSRMKKKTD